MLRRPERYAALLRVRRRKADQKAMELAAAERKVRRAQAERVQLEILQEAALQAAGATGKGPVDAFLSRQYLRYERHLAGLGVRKDADIRALSGQRDHRRQDLESAMKDQRVVEKLIDRAEEVQRLDNARRFRKALDEQAIVRWLMQQRRTDREGES